MAVLQEVYQKDPAWNAPIDPKLEACFERVKAKLVGFVSDPAQTLRLYPESDMSIPARYARAYAWHKSAYPEKALKEVEGLVALAPARSEEHTSELQSLMSISYAVFCLQKNKSHQ